jgi:peptidoglycan/LPS O-acetylase OafA/YrhL
LVGHFFPVSGINLGTVGVELFFVLSGLLMARVLFVQRTSFSTFYRRRISRIFPSVFTYLIVITTIFFLINKDVAFRELFSAITFTNNYFQTKDWKMPFGHIWSLSVEEHAYVILSIAAYWCRTRDKTALPPIAGILTVILLAIGVYSLLPSNHAPGFNLRTEVASFGIFLSGFLTLAVHQNRITLARWWITPLMLVTGILVHWWSVPDFVRLIIGPAALGLAINGMPSAPGWLLSIFNSRWLRTLGIYSFSLYLWQQPFYQLTHFDGLSPVLGLMFSLGVGWLAFHLIENPTRTYLNTHWGRKPDIPKSEPLTINTN